MNKLKTGMGLCLIFGWITVAGAEIPAQKPMGKK
ncbi:putative membrane protein [Neisseria musculi]|uniref:Membrane protein n=1 Tax=Neisseria musculi TaxID=1815583 RepID=A0A7H1M8F3_9NEIS|nr:putative membrane protein [Neisseria musculi]